MHNKSVWSTKRIFLCTKSFDVWKYKNFHFSTTSMKSCTFAPIAMTQRLHHYAVLSKQLLSVKQQQQRCFFNLNKNYTNKNIYTHNNNVWRNFERVFCISQYEFDTKLVSGNTQKENLLFLTENKLRNSTTMSKKSNKEFSFDDYDIIGFDLDCTLLRYNLNEMVPLIHNLLQKFLIDYKGYPVELYTKTFNAGFIQKGLIIDAERGNILKLSKDSKISRASHGTRMLKRDEIVEIYGPERIWDVAAQYCQNPLSTWDGPLSLKMRALLDYFDIASTLIFAQAVDVLDDEAKKKNETIISSTTLATANMAKLTAKPEVTAEKTSYNILPDILDGHVHLYGRGQFANGKSGYFNALKEKPERYVLRTNLRVIRLLKELRKAGKLLFLLTGSNIDFANLTATHALGDDWHKLFDVNVCYGRKPGFFTIQREFLCVDEVKLEEIAGSEINVDEDITFGAGLQANAGRAAGAGAGAGTGTGTGTGTGAGAKPGDKRKIAKNIFSQGNWQQLQKAFAMKLDKSVDELRTLYIGDNLMQDVYSPVAHHDFDSLALSEELSAESGAKYEFIDIVNSKIWGSYFKVDGKTTFWSSIIAKYTKMCVPTMETLADKKVKERFLCDNPLGYFPQMPKSLLEP